MYDLYHVAQSYPVCSAGKAATASVFPSPKVVTVDFKAEETENGSAIQHDSNSKHKLSAYLKELTVKLQG